MATVRRSAPGVLLAAALAVVTVACGPSHTPPPRAVMLDAQAVVDPLAGQTSVWILQHASRTPRRHLPCTSPGRCRIPATR